MCALTRKAFMRGGQFGAQPIDGSGLTLPLRLCGICTCLQGYLAVLEAQPSGLALLKRGEGHFEARYLASLILCLCPQGRHFPLVAGGGWFGTEALALPLGTCFRWFSL
jgi:hypothetical protein